MNGETGDRTTSLWRRAKHALGFDKASAEGASEHMFRLYCINLEVRLRAIDDSLLKTDFEKKLYADVNTAIVEAKSPSDQDDGWDLIYKAERLLALIMSGDRLRLEIDARLNEMARENIPGADVLRSEYSGLVKPAAGSGAVPADDGTLKIFILTVLESIQWAYKKKYLARPIRKVATKIILSCGLVALLLVLLPYAAIVWVKWDASTVVADGKAWSLFPLYTVMSAGLLGAFFSRLIMVQKRWTDMTLDEVFLHRELSYTLLRAGVGLCGALIVYFFLRSGLVIGALFPDIAKLSIDVYSLPIAEDKIPEVSMRVLSPSKDLALLIVWSFLAGFSEALVPSILTSTERELTNAATAAPAAPAKSA